MLGVAVAEDQLLIVMDQVVWVVGVMQAPVGLAGNPTLAAVVVVLAETLAALAGRAL